MIHPFHPLCGQEFELLAHHQNWGEDRVMFHDTTGRLRSMPASWTDLAAPDPFVALSEGRSFFRLEDLLRLLSLVRKLQGK